MKLHLKQAFHKMNHVFTHGSGKQKHVRVTRNPSSSQAKTDVSAPKHDYPLIRSFKPQNCVPLKIRGELQSYAKRTDNGVIQAIKQPHISVYSYPVIVMTEHDLEDSGFDRSDSANFSSSLTHRFVEPATFHEDIMSGRLAVIPSHKTIRTLASFDAMNRIKFHWGLITDSLTSNAPMSSAKVIMLHNTVSLSDLIYYDKHPQPMHIDEDRNLIVGKQSVSQETGASAQMGQQSQSVQQKQMPNMDQDIRDNNGPQPTTDNRVTPGTENARFNHNGTQVNSSDDNVPHLNDDGTKQTNQAPSDSQPNLRAQSQHPIRQNEQPTGNRQQLSGQGQSDQQAQTHSTSKHQGLHIPHLDTGHDNNQGEQPSSTNNTGAMDAKEQPNLRNENDGPSSQPSGPDLRNPDQQKVSQNDDQNQPESTNEQGADLRESEDHQTNDTQQPQPNLRGDNATPNGLDMATAQEDPALARAEQEYQQSTPQASSMEQKRQEQPTNDTSSDASKHMQSFVKHAFYDSDLGIKLDLSDLKRVLKQDRPFQFKLRKVNPKDPKSQLDVKINKRLQQMNFDLQQLHTKHMQSIYADSLNHLKASADQIKQILDPLRKHSSIHNKYEKINYDYRRDKAAQRKASQQLQIENKRDYEQQRRNYINTQTDRAKADYDQRHLGIFHAQQRRIAEYNDGSAENRRMKRRSHLKDWRSKLAKHALDKSVEQLGNRAQYLLDNSQAKERAQYFTDKHRINQMDGSYYKKEIQRAHEISYSKRHDHKVARIRKRAVADSHKWQTRLSELQANDRNDRKNIVRANRMRINALENNNSNLRQQVLDMISFAKKAGSKIPPKYAQSLKLQDIRYHNLQKTQNEQIRSLYQRINQIKQSYRKSWDTSQEQNAKTAKINAENRNNLLQSLTYKHKDDERRWHNAILGAIAAGVVLLIGATVVGHNWGQSSAKTHYVKRYIVQGSNKGSSGGGTHTTINNSTPTTNKPESHSSGSMLHQEHTKSHRKRSQIDRSLMTRRPPAKHGLYIGTSTAHHPTSFMYVKRVGFYKKGMLVTGAKNHSLVKLRVTRTSGDMIFVKDLTNNAYYEFNTY